MTNVVVPKDKLLETMRANRDRHRSIFLEAQVKYREKVIQTLDARLAQARAGHRINLTFNFPEPVDYTESYDEAIARFEWHQDDSVELAEDEFRQFVLDKWGWDRLFTANTRSYTG